MKRILVTDGMEKSAVEKLKNSGYEVVEQFYEPEVLKEQIKNFDAVVVRSATKVRQPIIDAALETGRLKLIIRGGVGVDNIDVDYAKLNGIAVANTPNASSASVAELAIGHMFCLARHIYIANHTMRQGKWNKKQYEGIELSGKTLGLVGFGRIAREVAKRAFALGMKVVYTNTSGAKEGFNDYKYMKLDELLAVSDFISMHIPCSQDQQPVIGEAQFAKMKDGVYLVNTARGGVVCEEALLKALDSGKVAAAALDVFEEEPTKNERIYTHERISLTPHIGASTNEAQERIGGEIIQIIQNFFE
ncbi:MAG TPA: D-2-hydroxyacid dehydrogenase [Bacillota bacterium]|nr:D-2-hydroxyacid dehydrogenase [Clostridiaceae bacterium]HNR04499.1 D-2-hydroxyacid dehydrogenase [Bacillota bacterium]HNT04033.1 D-2-hydroxyacid dehydrogenase [Bacillota bacterium]HPA54695.1 D-2-hydroxyacid dehydrogenase [Bacillota bacterium]HPX69436.1 D-2-hydroxyacid dehydrogenase [Bacillota bacterium]